MKKFDRLAQADKNNSKAAPSIQQADELIYNGMAVMDAPDSGRQTARPLDIDKIYPDETQPRRAMPFEIRRDWDNRPATIAAQVLRPWLVKVDEERAEKGVEHFDLNRHFQQVQVDEADTGKVSNNGDESNRETSHNPGPFEDGLLKVVRLAGTIQRDGLTNPITVIRRPDETFQIETGERRWLAYHLLRMIHGEDWRKIPAREMKDFDVWRQASENNARSDLNAIAKARQIAILLMHAWSQRDDCPIEIKPRDQFRVEQQYYAQALNLPTPYGEGQRLLDALGFKNMSTFSRHKNLLKLAEAVWHRADDTNCPEGVLRNMLDLSPEYQLSAFNSWKKRIFANGKDSESAPKKPKAEDKRPTWQRTLDREFSVKRWQEMPKKQRREALEYLKTLVLQLEEIS